MDNAYNWHEVEVHIERHESGCWTWDGAPLYGNVYRMSPKRMGLLSQPGRSFTVCRTASWAKSA